ncbi:Alpha/Beta hydrolase protein [Plectosphaerella plurivora]|uniref:Alpha/Beta hydrolase protein n=1 Tax=Plectosphaerella plurivora TaxID=936078 RepID=A0A9P9A8E4_9PEZI|nr:Alpha/Beta hydrolase protein [Plectosphaerella plurivora]
MSSQTPRFCADCFRGTLRGDVELAGAEEVINGLPTYVARPGPDVKPLGVVVILPDAIGWTLHNTRVLADSYARRIPAVVLLPEVMDGHAIPDRLLAQSDRATSPETSWWYKTFVLWPILAITMARYLIPLLLVTRSTVIVPRIKSYLSALRTSPPPGLPESHKTGIVGFCWGGKYATQLCQGSSGPFASDSLVDYGFTAHPSMLTVPDDFEKLTLPFSMANGDDDMMMNFKQIEQAVMVMEAKKGCEVEIYPGATHGFAVRGDPNDKKQGDFGMRAEDQAVAWFRKQFRGGDST